MIFNRLLTFIRIHSAPRRFEGKVFCIGFNKTGTTSIKKAFLDLGFAVGDQRTAELMLRSYIQNDFFGLIEYCQGAQVFQDVPFSWPHVYKVLDEAYPGSKFILTVRDTPEAWFHSLVTFHARVFGHGNTPTSEDLRNADYVWKGWAWETLSNKQLKDPEKAPYNPEDRMSMYTQHLEDVRAYFRDRPQDLLEINLKDHDAWARFCRFIGVGHQPGDFPWENKTEDIPVGGRNRKLS